jgi:hypothetical protein
MVAERPRSGVHCHRLGGWGNLTQPSCCDFAPAMHHGRGCTIAWRPFVAHGELAGRRSALTTIYQSAACM